jgi:hypothetical protein
MWIPPVCVAETISWHLNPLTSHLIAYHVFSPLLISLALFSTFLSSSHLMSSLLFSSLLSPSQLSWLFSADLNCSCSQLFFSAPSSSELFL